MSQIIGKRLSGSLTKTSSKEDFFEKIARISDKYEFINKPIAIWTDDPEVTEKTSSTEVIDTSNRPTIMCSFKKKSRKIDETSLEKVIYRNKTIETNTIKLLHEALDGCQNLTVLRLEFCNLTPEQLQMLAALLSTYDTIQEVSLNGNPLPEQNYNILLKYKLKYLSLKYCGITEEGTKLLLEDLHSPYDNCLQHLNLASNALFDEGVVNIAKILRMNRKLISLNLADNKIRNPGLISILEPLQKFELNHEELIIRRMFKLEYHKKLAANPIIINIIKEPSRVETRKQKKQTLSKKGASKSSIERGTKKPNHRQPDMPFHPILQDSVEEDSTIYCTGNHILLNLNLSYNRINNKVVSNIIEMLQYQKEFLSTRGEIEKTGISRLTLVGNDITTSAMTDIKSILEGKPNTYGLGGRSFSNQQIGEKRRHSAH